MGVIMEFGWEFINDFLEQQSFFDELISKNGKEWPCFNYARSLFDIGLDHFQNSNFSLNVFYQFKIE
jgi:hypothetical protein